MSELFRLEEYAVLLLIIATLVGVLARRMRMPYTVGLVFVGSALAIFFRQLHYEVRPEVILGIFVPPLIFEAAFHLPFNDLRRNLRPILLLASGGVVLTTFMVAGIVSVGSGLALSSAIVFGSIIAATDPVAVIALFKTLGVPKRLQVLIEGESLFNDGVAIVVFNIAVVAAATGKFSLRAGVGDFLVSAGGGIAVGLVLGGIVSYMISRVDDHLIETAMTFILAYGSFLVAEEFHLSGVLAVVAAGVVNGNIGPRGMSPTTRIVVFNFWEFMSFLANSFLFLLIGFAVDLPLLRDNWTFILWGVLAALVSRFVVVYGLLFWERSISRRWKHVMYWGGLRGAISLALVLGLTSKLPKASEQLLAMVFGLVIFTLLVQGTTMGRMVRRMGVMTKREDRVEYDLRRARAAATRSGFEHIERVYKDGMMSKHVWSIMSKVLVPYNRELAESMQDIIKAHPEVEAEELDAAWREFLRHQRLVLTELLTSNVISEDVYGELTGRIDGALETASICWSEIGQVNEALWNLAEDRPAARPPEG